jgi:hypothetical protein
LMQQLDSLAQEYSDFFMRPYIRLFISGFPLMIRSVLSGATNPEFVNLV